MLTCVRTEHHASWDQLGVYQNLFHSSSVVKVQLRKVDTQKEGVILQLALQMAMWWHFVSWADSSFWELPFKKSQCSHVALCDLITPLICCLVYECGLHTDHAKVGRWKQAHAPEGSVDSPCQFWSRVLIFMWKRKNSLWCLNHCFSPSLWFIHVLILPDTSHCLPPDQSPELAHRGNEPQPRVPGPCWILRRFRFFLSYKISRSRQEMVLASGIFIIEWYVWGRGDTEE